jgi:lactoylglutathione lyase
MKFTYTGIRVRDVKRSIDFYTRVMGMEVVLPPTKMKATGGLYAHLESKGSKQRLELNWYPESYARDYAEGDELDHLAFWLTRTESVDEEFKELKKKGAQVAIEPFSEGAYRLAFLKDPDGVWIELLGKRNNNNQ